ncbi:MAG: serine/threonine protein kinase [Gemmatimonadota bacterium]|nr:MAG: serine/threonine protein kinase [Gemmatimonadota bacterium]
MGVEPIPPERQPDRRGEQPDESMSRLQQALDGRYVLERKLGRGGMGVVYLAWETGLRRLVALKVLPPALATKGRRERFLKEARIAAGLEHRHIVPIHAVGEAGPFAYYTMGYVRGETLAQRILAEGALPVGDATRILYYVARAVEYAHEQGVVHRDLKPQNILLERDSGRPYVADFGLAQVVDDGLPPDVAEARMSGTIPYMSPEQAAGLPADRRSDVYSLGVMGYLMATGQPLFAGSLGEILEQHISRPAPPLRVFGRHLDTTLARAVGRCLRKDPRERFQSAGELVRALAPAPEIRSDLPKSLRDFVARMTEESRLAGTAVVLALPALWVLGGALQSGNWVMAAATLGFLGVLALSPVAGALLPTRRLLEKRRTRADMVRELNIDLDCQREQIVSRRGRRVSFAKATWARRVTGFCAGLFGLGTLAALLDAGLPADLVGGGIIIGAFGSVLGGGVIVWRERWRNQLVGNRWLRFWESRLGGWTAKLAGIGLGLGPGAFQLQPEPVAAEEPAESAWLPRPSGNGRGAFPDLVQELADLVGRTESCISSIHARLAAGPPTAEPEGRSRRELESEETLQRQLAVLEALLDRLREADPITGVPDSLKADLEAAREICEVVEGLIAGKEWGGAIGDFRSAI